MTGRGTDVSVEVKGVDEGIKPATGPVLGVHTYSELVARLRAGWGHDLNPNAGLLVNCKLLLDMVQYSTHMRMKRTSAESVVKDLKQQNEHMRKLYRELEYKYRAIMSRDEGHSYKKRRTSRI